MSCVRLKDMAVKWMSLMHGCHVDVYTALYATFSTIITILLKRSFGRKELHFIHPKSPSSNMVILLLA